MAGLHPPAPGPRRAGRPRQCPHGLRADPRGRSGHRPRQLPRPCARSRRSPPPRPPGGRSRGSARGADRADHRRRRPPSPARLSPPADRRRPARRLAGGLRAGPLGGADRPVRSRAALADLGRSRRGDPDARVRIHAGPRDRAPRRVEPCPRPRSRTDAARPRASGRAGYGGASDASARPQNARGLADAGRDRAGTGRAADRLRAFGAPGPGQPRSRMAPSSMSTALCLLEALGTRGRATASVGADGVRRFTEAGR